jgi:hypothetical protein
MVIRKALVALAAAGMVFGSTAAAAAPVAADVRAASPVAEAEGLRGGSSWAWILALIILAGVIGVIASDGDENLPDSP